ncbi:hypothetical protein [Synechococcus sp. MIT S1220]|uniref:hypothetical protein n=1 Tax=Synechococcus sp. MIT S1220 TaxID=3082549 RepID=UPI0039AF6C1D
MARSTWVCNELGVWWLVDPLFELDHLQRFTVVRRRCKDQGLQNRTGCRLDPSSRNSRIPL